MENLLGQIYCWFQSFYGQDLSYYLWGYDPGTEAYTNPNIYNFVGLITLVVSLVLVVVFYYIINHPRLCKWWSWLIALGINGVIALFVGYGIVMSKYVNGYIHDTLMYQRDADGNIISILIGESNCWGFGIANMFVAMIAFVLLSFMLKWWSSSAKHVPFL